MTGKTVTACQSCGGSSLEEVLFLGWLPPVNTFFPVGSPPGFEVRWPAQLLRCGGCSLVQMGYEAPADLVFPPGYSYRSGVTKALRENFVGLAWEVADLFPKSAGGLAVDVGCNDGSLLKELRAAGYETQGIEPTDAYRDAQAAGLDVVRGPLDSYAVDEVVKRRGKAKVVTACNVFAHIPDPNGAVRNVLEMLDDDGVFVSESHYLPDLLAGVQYDAVYHEHLRYYSLNSLKHLFQRHGIEVIRAKKIPTHGGSIRVYAARVGKYPVDESVELLDRQDYQRLYGSISADGDVWATYRRRVANHRVGLVELMYNLSHKRVFGVGAPSRAVTLANYCGLTHDVIECICEVPSSPKVGGYLPGTRIPVVDEKALYEEQPEYALLFSWHLADELIPKLRMKGYRGKFIVPLPETKVVA